MTDIVYRVFIAVGIVLRGQQNASSTKNASNDIKSKPRSNGHRKVYSQRFQFVLYVAREYKDFFEEKLDLK